MHHKTFDQVQEEIWQLDALAIQGISEQFGNPFDMLK
jgi:hypothetical protein